MHLYLERPTRLASSRASQRLPIYEVLLTPIKPASIACLSSLAVYEYLGRPRGASDLSFIFSYFCGRPKNTKCPRMGLRIGLRRALWLRRRRYKNMHSRAGHHEPPDRAGNVKLNQQWQSSGRLGRPKNRFSTLLQATIYLSYVVYLLCMVGLAHPKNSSSISSARHRLFIWPVCKISAHLS